MCHPVLTMATDTAIYGNFALRAGWCVSVLTVSAVVDSETTGVLAASSLIALTPVFWRTSKYGHGCSGSPCLTRLPSR